MLEQHDIYLSARPAQQTLAHFSISEIKQPVGWIVLPVTVDESRARSTEVELNAAYNRGEVILADLAFGSKRQRHAGELPFGGYHPRSEIVGVMDACCKAQVLSGVKGGSESSKEG
jgi:hypothetical protein